MSCRIVLCLSLLYLIPLTSVAQSRRFEILKNLELMDQVHEYLDLYYVDEPATGYISKVAIDEMLKKLDPYTVFYHESNMEDYRLMATGQYGGIGALIRKMKEYTCIVQPYENSPAFKSGLKAGDKILTIDGVSMVGKSSDDVSSFLKGPRGTTIEVEIDRPIAGLKKFKVTREEIKLPDLPYTGMLSNKIGYVKLSSFSQTAFNSVKQAFDELKGKGMETAILDLRDNGGGLLMEAIRIVNLFVPKGQLIVSTKGRLKEENRAYKTREKPAFPEMRLVVLINERSASASEIVAGSLQDLDRAIVVGGQSYGKGLVQRTYDLKYGSKLKLTISKYYTPSGRCVQRLEYYEKGAKDKPSEISDTLLTTFKTKNGRDVIDGRGIFPDIEVKQEKLGRLSSLLLMEDIVFDFATDFANTHDSISGPGLFTLKDEDYRAFIEFVLENEKFTFETASEIKLKELKKITDLEGYSEAIASAYKEISELVSADLEKELTSIQPEISRWIESEIISRYYFQSGASIHGFRFDLDVIKAKELLLDIDTYNNILKL
ncbi:MAG: peptidase S41 [Cryomorphaceae bacterium]|nr:peptidase S41 [Cryomorphaceae bacterium]